ncbi:MAG: Zn-ribbon domain-containing OB-fold protein [Actinobacteria bacterium]|nr:Zn-ribbon domain-containing OB-fold protein [Actinomycetota bacterium]NIS36539.1 Zn-ribbon domain-containing OB-fold protein [Actinomycetota bacterium]NIU22389.1 Zn-ribbon domain-containing OB-fold protein [Actinomycetota bacterium]NIU71050.1 Zn-ribbon domain-containing OB-fold protein [Actinomycetota bacterium]NIV90549.1 hypothetical protein [Actinomycetota bacterium]
MSDQNEALRLEYLANFEYDYAAGRYATRFMSELKETTRLFGTECSWCGRVYVPPRPLCGICSAPTKEEWVEVGPKGTLTGFTVVEIPFIDPMTGKKRPVPYGFAFVRLEGCDTNMYHFIDETDHSKMWVGMQVEAVFKPDGEREGKMSDIMYFKTLETK